MDMFPLSLFLFCSLSLSLLFSFSLTLRLHDLALFAGVVSSNQLSERKSQFNYSSVSSPLALSSLHYDKTACNVKHICVCVSVWGWPAACIEHLLSLEHLHFKLQQIELFALPAKWPQIRATNLWIFSNLVCITHTKSHSHAHAYTQTCHSGAVESTGCMEGRRQNLACIFAAFHF